jgi:hypothetical protein
MSALKRKKESKSLLGSYDGICRQHFEGLNQSRKKIIGALKRKTFRKKVCLVTQKCNRTKLPYGICQINQSEQKVCLVCCSTSKTIILKEVFGTLTDSNRKKKLKERYKLFQQNVDPEKTQVRFKKP